MQTFSELRYFPLQGRIQELITKGRWGAQEYEYNYEGREGCTRVWI